MKKFVCLLIGVAAIASMLSCDSKKSEIKNLTKQFVTALNEQDRVTVYEMYPASKSLMGLLPEKLEIKGVKVASDGSTGIYTASFNAEKNQQLVFKADSAGLYKIDDSFGVMTFDSITREFAIKAGVPMKTMSDKDFAALMNEDSLFMAHLTHKYFNEIHGNLSMETGYWNWGQQAGVYYMRAIQTIKNRGDVPVKGEDYNVEFRLSDWKNGITTTKVIPGVDLAPGEITEITTDAPAFYKAAVNKTLYIDVVIKFKNMTTQGMMLKYAKLTGEEYQGFLELQKKDSEAANGPSEEDGELPEDYDSLPDED